MILISGSWGRISGRKTSVAGHAPTTRHFYDKPKEKDVHVLLHQGTFIKMNNQNNRNSLFNHWRNLLLSASQQNSDQRNNEVEDSDGNIFQDFRPEFHSKKQTSSAYPKNNYNLECIMRTGGLKFYKALVKCSNLYLFTWI